MNEALVHGGPDGQGVASSGDTVFGHCRLAIIAPNETGSQPFVDGSDLLTYNGELYNYRELRKELRAAGRSFTTDTDTEVILRSLQHWGVDALRRFNGMFALAYWNGKQESLTLARDHVGMKPLYYAHWGEELVFTSEFQALRLHPSFSNEVDSLAVNEFLRRGYINAPRTICKAVRKVIPGTALTFSLREPIPRQYEFYRAVDPVQPSKPEDFEDVFRAACERHLLADVPVGVLLSGGVDSSLITAMVKSLSSQPVRTYTLGFSNPSFDEAPAAEQLAKHLRTRHQTFRTSPEELTATLDRLTKTYGEPFGDASALATMLLSERVSLEVKCVLGGDGGDELFGGYVKYRATEKFAQYKGWVPLRLRQKIGKGLAENPEKLSGILASMGRESKHNEDRIHKLGNSLQANNKADFFARASDYSSQNALRDLGVPPRQKVQEWPEGNLLYKMACEDLRSFLPGDLMVKTDRAAMAHGLEVRFPFLDKELIDFALRLPDQYKIKEGAGKVLLRKILATKLPPNLHPRGKSGFSIPLNELLRSVLREGLQEMAKDEAFHLRFGFPTGSVKKMVIDFQKKLRYVNAYPVWFLYTLYRWHQVYPK